MKFNVFIFGVLSWTSIVESTSVLIDPEIPQSASSLRVSKSSDNNRFKRHVFRSKGNSISEELYQTNNKDFKSEISKINARRAMRGGRHVLDLFNDQEYQEEDRDERKRYYGQRYRPGNSKTRIIGHSSELGRNKESRENHRRVLLMDDGDDYEAEPHRCQNSEHNVADSYEFHSESRFEKARQNKFQNIKVKEAAHLSEMNKESKLKNHRLNEKNEEHDACETYGDKSRETNDDKRQNRNVENDENKTERSQATTAKSPGYFTDKNQILAHFSLQYVLEEFAPPRTARTTKTEAVTVPSQQEIRSTIPTKVNNLEKTQSTTWKIHCLPYSSGEDLFDYYLRNISQGRTTEFFLTRKRIRFARTTTTERGPGVYDSVTSVPGYFDDSLGKLIDEYVDSRALTNTSEVMRIRERDARWLKEAEEREKRGDPVRSEEFEESVWRRCPVVTSMTPRRPTTPPPPTTEPEEDIYDYVIGNKKRRRVGPAEPILRTLITREPYEMFERIFGKVTKVLPITFSS